MVGLRLKDQVEIVATEDSMEALIEYFVSPLLLGSDHVNPSLSQQQSLAKQMQAVVLLYNFYHRIQFPQLEFLSFQSLCKSSTIANPKIVSYLQFMKKQQTSQTSTISSDDLSLVEKAVRNACDVSISLYDAFNDGWSIIETWPVERIGVFLLDEKREKCLLQKYIVVKGVWSLLEREIDREKGVLSEYYEDLLEKFAVSEVKNKTGIESSYLRIKYRHLTYSSHKEKSAIRVYIMEYTKKPTKNGLVEIPINHVINSLKGDVIKMGSPPGVTSKVSFYLLLPYIEIISNWLENPPKDDLNNSQISPIKMNQKVPMEIEESSNSQMKPTRTNKMVPMEIRKCQNNASQKVQLEREKTQKNIKNEIFGGSQTEPMKIEKAQNNVTNQNLIGSKKEPMEIKNSQKVKGINGNEKIDNKRKHDGPSNYASETNPSKGEKESGTSGTSKYMNAMVCKEAIQHCDKSLIKTEIVLYEKKDLESCLETLLKKRDEMSKMHRVCEDEIAQCEMDIHTMISEGAITPKVKSIISKWANQNPNSSEGSQIQIKKKLKLKCSIQELDEVCRDNNLILPRYTVIPSISDGMYTASASIKGADFECTANSELRKTPREAREQAALYLLCKLHNVS